MNSLPRSLGRLLQLLTAVALWIPLAGLADTVKLKSGETFEGRITYEGSDFIKLEVAISATIKDTKVIPRADIEEMVKAAPDDVAIGELRKKLPVPALTSAPAYRSLIDAGPARFLKEFPTSSHKPEVEKILSELQAELDQVERGFVKLDGEWISPQDQKQYLAQTKSRIVGIVLQRKLAQRDYLGALRDFEILEERFYGTPAHVAAIPTVQKLIPVFGAQLSRAQQDVAYRNQKWEADKGLLDELARSQVEQARAQEVANFERATENEKAAGVKWLTISQNSAESLAGAVALIQSEMERLNAVDLAAMTAMSEKLVEADKLIAEGKIEEGGTTITEALALVSDGSKSSSRRKSSSRSKSSTKAEPKSYVEALYLKINEVEEARAVAKQQMEDELQGAEAAGVIMGGDTKKPLVDANLGEGAEEGEASKSSDQGSALTGLMASGSEDESKEEDEKKSGSSSKKSSSKKSEKKDDDDDDRPLPDEEEEGGIGFQTIMIGVAGLLVLTIVVMKLMGVGGKKEEEKD